MSSYGRLFHDVDNDKSCKLLTAATISSWRNYEVFPVIKIVNLPIGIPFRIDYARKDGKLARIDASVIPIQATLFQKAQFVDTNVPKAATKALLNHLPDILNIDANKATLYCILSYAASRMVTSKQTGQRKKTWCDGNVTLIGQSKATLKDVKSGLASSSLVYVYDIVVDTPIDKPLLQLHMSLHNEMKCFTTWHYRCNCAGSQRDLITRSILKLYDFFDLFKLQKQHGQYYMASAETDQHVPDLWLAARFVQADIPGAIRQVKPSYKLDDKLKAAKEAVHKEPVKQPRRDHGYRMKMKRLRKTKGTSK